MRLGDLGLKAKITACNLIPVTMLIVLSVVVGLALNHLLENVSWVSFTYDAVVKSRKIRQRAVDMETSVRGYLLTGDESYLQLYAEARKQIQEVIADVKKQVEGNPEATKLLEEMSGVLQKWLEEVSTPQIDLRRQINQSKTIEELARLVATVEGKRYTDKFRELMKSFEALELRLLAERKMRSDQTAARVRKAVVAGTLIVIAISLIASYLVAGAVTRPLAEALSFAEGIRRGELTGQLPVTNRDEVGRLRGALNAMAKTLRTQAHQVLEGVNALASVAPEINATITQLVSGTTQTSTAISETTTTVEQVKQSALVSKDKAMSVSESSRKAVAISLEGRKATQETVDRMNLIKTQMESIGETVVRLSDQSRAIEDIIASVQDLADQSNLLAVNASIEAARAGDQGKGFAVVAQEIKTLADQSKEATEHVRSILDDTRRWVSAAVMATEQGGKAVEAGLHQSLSAGEAIQTLANNVAEAAQMAGMIQVASDQQVQGVEQVASAMASISTAVQQNVSGTTQLEDMAQRITEVGGSLKNAVQHFQV